MDKGETKNGYVIAAILLLIVAVIIAVNPIHDRNAKPKPPPAVNTHSEEQDIVPAEHPRKTNDVIDERDEIFDVVENEATYKGGEEAMTKFITRHIKYPEIAIQMGDQGKVYVRFVIEKNGAVSNVSIARSVSPELDKEAMRVIEKMPPWTPGTHRGKAVRTNVVVPIVFKLR